MPRGTSFGLRNAIQKTTSTMAADSSMSRIGLVNWKPPIEKIGLKKKSSIVGAG